MPTPWPIPEGLRVVELGDGYPLAYRDHGEGRPLLLIHGSFNDCRTWDAQFASLAASFRVVAPSLRHCHPEPWDGVGSDFTIEQHAKDVAGLVRALGLERGVVLGHSRGGAVALHLALSEPDLPGGLILADPRGLEALLPRSPEGGAANRELGTLFADVQRHLACGDREGAARAFVDGLGGAGAWDRRSPALKQMFFDNIATAVDRGDAPPLGCAEVEAMRCPVLLMTGARSPARYARAMAAFLRCAGSRARSVVIPEAGHAMHRENPIAFNAAIAAFVETAYGPARRPFGGPS